MHLHLMLELTHVFTLLCALQTPAYCVFNQNMGLLFDDVMLRLYLLCRGAFQL